MMHPNRFQLALVGVLALLGGGRVCGQGWTETFDEGVGRFDITTGQGGNVFAYNSDNEDLDW